MFISAWDVFLLISVESCLLVSVRFSESYNHGLFLQAMAPIPGWSTGLWHTCLPIFRTLWSAMPQSLWWPTILCGSKITTSWGSLQKQQLLRLGKLNMDNTQSLSGTIHFLQFIRGALAYWGFNKEKEWWWKSWDSWGTCFWWVILFRFEWWLESTETSWAAMFFFSFNGTQWGEWGHWCPPKLLHLLELHGDYQKTFHEFNNNEKAHF